MKCVVFGSRGIIGQHMRLEVPQFIDSVYFSSRKTGPDLTNQRETYDYLDDIHPNVVINLAGENRVDIVELDPDTYNDVNVLAPARLAMWCDENDSHFIQASTQGIFSGQNAPYYATDIPHPITKYGSQKVQAEEKVQHYNNWTIARLTFVLGLRIFGTGRINPVESMLSMAEQLQVNDRWFSPLFATDAAKQLWNLARNRNKSSIYHLGIPVRVTRYQLATQFVWSLGPFHVRIHPVSHEHFVGIAPRPVDTTWAEGSLFNIDLYKGIQDILEHWDGYRYRPTS